MESQAVGPGDERDTKERILDAAEKLFADHGFAATSLRSITTDAGANLAAVNYHFGSKEQLIGAVLSRRVNPLNQERLRLLDEAQAAAGDAGPTVESILEAFVGPALRMSRDPARGGDVFMRLLGHAMSSPNEQIRVKLFDRFREVLPQFLGALGRAVPGLPPDEIYWRLFFCAGSMAHTMACSQQLERLSGGLCTFRNAEEMLRRLVPFLSAAFRVPAQAEGGGGS